MIKVMRVDQDGLFIEDVLLEDLAYEISGDTIQVNDEMLIVVAVPEGMYLPKWDGESWVEGMSQEEIDAIRNVVVEKTEVEVLREEQRSMQDALDFLLMGGM